MTIQTAVAGGMKDPFEDFLFRTRKEFSKTRRGLDHLIINVSKGAGLRENLPQIVIIQGLNIPLNPLPQFNGLYGDKNDYESFKKELLESNYCILPQVELSQVLKIPIHTLAQYGVSSKTPFLEKGLYNKETDNIIIDALHEIHNTNGRKILPVTHSFSTYLGMQLLDPIFLSEHGLENIVLPGILVTPFVSSQEALHDFPIQRIAFSFVGMLYSLLNGWDVDPKIPLPLYPLAAQEHHVARGTDDIEKLPEILRAQRIINLASANYLLSRNPQDEMQRRQHRAQNKGLDFYKALAFITQRDGIFNEEEQRKLLEEGLDMKWNNMRFFQCGQSEIFRDEQYRKAFVKEVIRFYNSQLATVETADSLKGVIKFPRSRRLI